MTYEFKRKNIRLPVERYQGQHFYFVTACFDKRHPYGNQPKLARWVIQRLREHAAMKHFLIHAYTLMPDHLHFLAEGTNGNCDLLPFVASFKKETGFEFESKEKRRLWQIKYYDHILRSKPSVAAVCWYIWLNPVRKGICRNHGEYAFSGSFTEQGTQLLNKPPVIGWVPTWKVQRMAAPKSGGS